jgi:hypothetical protein
VACTSKVPVKKLVLLFLLVGCSPPDYISTNGIEYYYVGTAPWETTQIETQENGFLQKAMELDGYQDAHTVLFGVQVYVYPSKFRCIGSPTGWCAGQEDYQILSVVDLGSPGKSAAMHEVAHWLQLKLHGVNDYDHLEVALWNVAEVNYCN